MGGAKGEKGIAKKEDEEEEREEPRLRPQSLNRMLQALLVHHFSLMKVLACTTTKSKTLEENE